MLPPPVRVIIADDHQLIRTGFKSILQQHYPEQIEFVAEAKNGAELLEAVEAHQPMLVITDIQMPVVNGIEACRTIRDKYPAVPVIAFSMFTDTGNIVSMLRAGASGYISKHTSHEEIALSIQSVYGGKPYYCSTISERLFGKTGVVSKANAKKVSFSDREVEIMRFICQEYSTKEIAVEMKMAARTIENARYHIQEKIGAKNMVGVALYAVLNGLVRQEDLVNDSACQRS